MINNRNDSLNWQPDSNARLFLYGKAGKSVLPGQDQNEGFTMEGVNCSARCFRRAERSGGRGSAEGEPELQSGIVNIE